MTNRLRTVVYIGVTADLRARVEEHKNHTFKRSFTAKYHCEFCVFYEHFPTIMQAISREKEIKKWRRDKKNELINSMNPNWEDLSPIINSW